MQDTQPDYSFSTMNDARLTLAPETVAELRAALVRQPAAGRTANPELHAALGRMAADARAQGVRAEQLVVAFKAVWHALPVVLEAADRHGDARRLEQLVMLCIREYYA